MDSSSLNNHQYAPNSPPQQVQQQFKHEPLTNMDLQLRQTDVLLQLRSAFREFQDEMRDTLRQINQKLSTREAHNPTIFEAPAGFPIECLREFDNFESDDQARHNELQSHLEFLGGQNLREALHNFVRATLTHEISNNFTWTGKSTRGSCKRPMSKTKLIQIFYKAAKKIRQIRNFTRTEFVTNFQEVLRSYKQSYRNSRRNNSPRRNNNEDIFPLSDKELIV